VKLDNQSVGKVFLCCANDNCNEADHSKCKSELYVALKKGENGLLVVPVFASSLALIRKHESYENNIDGLTEVDFNSKKAFVDSKKIK